MTRRRFLQHCKATQVRDQITHYSGTPRFPHSYRTASRRLSKPSDALRKRVYLKAG